MNSLTLCRKLAFGLFIWGLCSVATMEVFAGECEVKDAASLEGCKDKGVKALGPRVEMTDVPEHFMMADPSFSGGEELQDYMKVGDVKVILHTKDEVDCPGKIEATGTLKQIELEGNKAWVITVTGFKCK